MSRICLSLSCAAAVALVAVTTVEAVAQPRPWAEGVSPERQERALALHVEGNRFLREALFADALARYREAVAVWEHPSIRFKMAVALFNLNQRIAAYESFVKALRYGAAPLGDGEYARAQNYKKLLDAELARIEVGCAEDGAEVTLDGAVLFTGSGRAERLLMPGRHQIVARKAGYLTSTESLVLEPGEKRSIEMSLEPVLPRTVVKRRWRPWKPWLAVGVGAGLALVGGGLQLQAGSDFDAYEVAVAGYCSDMPCDPESDLPEAVRAIESRAIWKNRAALTLMATGGTTVLAGMILVLVNQPRAMKVEAPVEVVLTPTREGVSAVMAVRF